MHYFVGNKKNVFIFNPIRLRQAKIVYNFGLSESNRVKRICKQNRSGIPFSHFKESYMKLVDNCQLNASVQ